MKHHSKKAVKRPYSHPIAEKKPTTKIEWWPIAILAAAIVIVLVILFVSKGTGEISGDVVATVNGEPITAQELDIRYGTLTDDMKASVSKLAVLEQQLIPENLLYQEALKEGYKASDKEVGDVVAQSIAMSGLPEDEFYSRLAMGNLTKEYLMDYYARQISINKMLNDTILSKITVTEDQARKFYDDNPDLFQVPELRNASHILLRFSDDKTEDQVLKEANALYRKLNAANFAQTAMEVSEDPQSAVQGGNLGYFSKGMMVPEFEDAAFSLKEGQISKPIRTDFGYHIIYLIDIQEPTVQKYEDVKDQIMAQIRYNDQLSMYNEFYSGLKEGADIEVFYSDNLGVEGAPTYQLTGDPLCTDESGKPIVRMYSTSTCPHCKWIGETFDSVVSEYAAQGKISAYHYNLDTGDNVLTPEVEDALPDAESLIFEKYSPQQQVPVFVIGCEYRRIGNAYEGSQNGLAMEESELRAAIDSLLG